MSIVVTVWDIWMWEEHQIEGPEEMQTCVLMKWQNQNKTL